MSWHQSSLRSLSRCTTTIQNLTVAKCSSNAMLFRGIPSIGCNASSSSGAIRFKSSPSLHKKAIKALLNNNNERIPRRVTLERGESVKKGGAGAKKNNNVESSNNSKDSVQDAKSIVEPSSADEPIAAAVKQSTEVEQKPIPTTQEAEIPRRSIPPAPELALHEFAPRIVVVGVGGAGGNALNNMIAKDLVGVDFLALNTDAQHLATTLTDQRIQLGVELTRGLGCGANPDAGRMAAEESRDNIRDKLDGAHMVFITAGMGGGTGTGAAPVVADICYQLGILTVGVVTVPFSFEGTHRRKLANNGIDCMQSVCDTLITIPNQNLFNLAGPKTTFAEAFQMADDVLLGGVKSITDLMTSPGLINLDFADVQSVMVGMGNAILGTGVASSGQQENDECDRSIQAAQMALDNPLLGTDWDISTAKGMLVNITGGSDMTLFEVDRAAQLITEKVQDANANIIFGSAYDQRLDGSIRVSVVATGIEEPAVAHGGPEKENDATTSTTTAPQQRTARNFFNY